MGRMSRVRASSVICAEWAKQANSGMRGTTSTVVPGTRLVPRKCAHPIYMAPLIFPCTYKGRRALCLVKLPRECVCVCFRRENSQEFLDASRAR